MPVVIHQLVKNGRTALKEGTCDCPTSSQQHCTINCMQYTILNQSFAQPWPLSLNPKPSASLSKSTVIRFFFVAESGGGAVAEQAHRIVIMPEIAMQE